MKRISTATRVINKFGAGKDGFTDGSVVGGVASTDLEASWFDGVQEEIMNVLQGAGIAPDGSDLTQLRQAIMAITPGRFMAVKVISATGVYTPTAGTKVAVGEGVGGGGAGGGTPTAAAAATAASGGAAGSYGRFVVFNPVPVTITIGAKGLGVANAAGGNGGQTSYGALAVFPGGGGAPVAGTASTPAVTASGGLPSAAPTGSALLISFPGAVGATPGYVLSATSAIAGGGGASQFGSPGGTSARNGTVAVDGANATGYGAGGGGAIGINNGATTKGGDGSPGVVVIVEYGAP